MYVVNSKRDYTFINIRGANVIDCFVISTNVKTVEVDNFIGSDQFPIFIFTSQILSFAVSAC